MNSNLPIPYEPMGVPYLRPHRTEKKKPLRRFLALGLVVAMLVGIVCAVRFLPNGIKTALGAWLFGEESDVTQTTDTTESTGETTAPPTQTENIYQWQGVLPEGATPILPADRSANALCIYAENPTDAVLESVEPAFPKKGSGEISVIILNTHSFEGYAEDGALYYEDPSFAVNGASEMRVSAVARALCEGLSARGIGAVFVDCMCESSLGSYQNAARLAELALEDHPEAVLAVDIHRAVMTDEKGALLRPIARVEDMLLAQVRILLGTKEHFDENAAAALSLYHVMMREYENLAMPLRVSDASLLQSLPIPVLTLEIGSAGNFVAEAEQTAGLLAQIFANLME